jgi:toxin ParE1/3/4
VNRYVVLPQADEDLEDQAFYYATQASPQLGHRFLVAAHDTFALVATHPEMGWHSSLKHHALRDLRVFRVTNFERILILYRPYNDHVEIVRVVHGSRNIRRLLLEKLPQT